MCFWPRNPTHFPQPLLLLHVLLLTLYHMLPLSLSLSHVHSRPTHCVQLPVHFLGCDSCQLIYEVFFLAFIWPIFLCQLFSTAKKELLGSPMQFLLPDFFPACSILTRAIIAASTGSGWLLIPNIIGYLFL